jgi:hypothetical protein
MKASMALKPLKTMAATTTSMMLVAIKPLKAMTATTTLAMLVGSLMTTVT